MFMFDPNGALIQGFILATGIIGQFYAANMDRKCFMYWLASNIALIAVSLYFHSYGQLSLYVFFSVMAIYSYFKWAGIQSASQAPAPQPKKSLVIDDDWECAHTTL